MKNEKATYKTDGGFEIIVTVRYLPNATVPLRHWMDEEGSLRHGPLDFTQVESVGCMAIPPSAVAGRLDGQMAQARALRDARWEQLVSHKGIDRRTETEWDHLHAKWMAAEAECDRINIERYSYVG